jgi:prepilin-type processing-associated H-X9-DG protein
MAIEYGAFTGNIPDGASTTIMFTELRSGVNAQDPRGCWALGYPGSSVTAANAIGDCLTPNNDSEDADDVSGCPNFKYAGIGLKDQMGCGVDLLGFSYPSWQAQSRSMHPGQVSVCFADGSVRFISNYVSPATWFYMLSSCDGANYTEN